MDCFNLVVIAGRLAVPPEPGDGHAPARLLLTVQSEHPTPRVDLLPVVTDVGGLPLAACVGDGVWVAGSLQRRFPNTSGRSRLEVVAHHIEHKPGTG